MLQLPPSVLGYIPGIRILTFTTTWFRPSALSAYLSVLRVIKLIDIYRADRGNHAVHAVSSQRILQQPCGELSLYGT